MILVMLFLSLFGCESHRGSLYPALCHAPPSAVLTSAPAKAVLSVTSSSFKDLDNLVVTYHRSPSLNGKFIRLGQSGIGKLQRNDCTHWTANHVHHLYRRLAHDICAVYPNKK